MTEQFVVLLEMTGRHRFQTVTHSEATDRNGEPIPYDRDGADKLRSFLERTHPIYLSHHDTGGLYIVRSLEWWRKHQRARETSQW